MEDALVLPEVQCFDIPVSGLNPCFNGRCTSTAEKKEILLKALEVLILVLMEDALVQQNYSNA